MTLSILCITKLEPHAVPFVMSLQNLADSLRAEFVLGLDSPSEDSLRSIRKHAEVTDRLVPVDAQGCLENVHDFVLGHCTGDYVLRIDDDEQCSPAMKSWLALQKYREHDHWSFPRAHLWGSPKMMLKTPQLWPDFQTRLSVRAKAGGRLTIHDGSPFGGGERAPVLIEHHVFLVRSQDERIEKVRRYDAIAQGAGTAFMPFIVPEIAYRGESLKTIPLNDGRTDTGYYEQGCGGCGKWVTL